MKSIFLSLLFWLASAHCDCAFEQTTSGHPNPLPPGSLPFVPPTSINAVCPQYSDLACCSQTQITLLSLNLFAIKTFFLNVLDGGCPACANNLMRFWCLFTCSPQQSDFVASLGIANVTVGTTTYTVLKRAHRYEFKRGVLLLSRIDGSYSCWN